MDGYRIGLTGHALDYTVKKYKGHRNFPKSVLAADMQKELDEKVASRNKRKYKVMCN